MSEAAEAFEAPVNPSIALRASAEATLEAALAGKEAPAAPEPVVVPPAADPVAAALPDPAQADIAARVAELVRLESEQVRARQEVRAEAEAARGAASKAEAELAAFRAQLRENPLELLKANQWDIEQLIRAEASQGTPEAVRVARLEAKLQEFEAGTVKQSEAAKAADVARSQAEARATLTTQLIPAALEVVKDEIPVLTAWLGSREAVVEAVFDLMGREFTRTKGAATLEPQDAARKLEAQMRERVKRLPSVPVTTDAPEAASPKPVVKPSVTVTNKSTQHRGSTPQVDPFDVAALRKRAMDEAAAMFAPKV